MADFKPDDIVAITKVLSSDYETGVNPGPKLNCWYRVVAVHSRGGLQLAGLPAWWRPGNFTLVGGPRTVARPSDGDGRKDDSGKLDITLLFDDMPHALEAVAEVLQWAITKKQPTPYERGSWQHVSDFQQRYRAAQLRHQLAAAKEAITRHVDSTHTRDAETGLLQLAHIATDALFQLEMAVRDIKENGSA